MSQENVDVVRRLVGLTDGVDVAQLVRDDGTWTTYAAEVEAIYEPECAFSWILYGREATGLDEVRQVWLDLCDPWESVRNEVERLIPVGDRVVALGRQHARMAGIEHEVELIGASAYLVRDGRVARVEHYANRAVALEAVGLRE
jgi:ketosteroid isomerase-like protein